MNIKHRQDGKGGTFYLEENGTEKAALLYEMNTDNEMVINHTEVDKELRGKDVGQQLVKAAVEFSRGKKIKIIPVCSFAASIFKRTKEYEDVLA